MVTDPYFHPIVTAWVSENSFDVRKRSIAAATYNTMLQIGAIIASRKTMFRAVHGKYHNANQTAEIYRAKDAPYYHTGNAVLLSISALSMVVIIAQKFYLKKLNREKLSAWNAMTLQEQAEYQNDQAAREKDGNKRFDLLFKT